MENKDFELRYNLTGSDRKRLVTSIAEILNSPAKYKGAPSFGYEVDYFTIDKNGTISFDDRAAYEEVDMRFHVAVAKASRISLLETIIRMLRETLRYYYEEQRLQFDLSATYPQHRAIFEAIRDHDPVRATAAMNNNVSYLISRIEQGK